VRNVSLEVRLITPPLPAACGNMSASQFRNGRA
jgi:hypothetical protein